MIALNEGESLLRAGQQFLEGVETMFFDKKMCKFVFFMLYIEKNSVVLT